MKKKGIIKNPGKLVFSDPWYAGKDVWCKFETNLGRAKHDFALRTYKDEDGTWFDVLIQKTNVTGHKFLTDNNEIGSLVGYKGLTVSEEHTIGMDTASVYLGKEKYFGQTEFRTGTDGEFGSVWELFDKDKKLIGIYLAGFFYHGFVDEKEIWDTLKETFEVEEV